MKKGKFIIIAIATIIVLAGGGFAFVSRSQVAQNSPEVLSDETSETAKKAALPKLEIFTGKVEVKLPGEEFKEGQNNQDIPEGTVVKTNNTGRAQVIYPNNSVTRIDHNSLMTLENFQDSPSQTKVQIDEGRIWNRVIKLLGKDDSFESETETLVASVRGTSYGHGIQADGSNKVSVSRSIVEVDCYVGSQPNVNVETNKKITTKCLTGFGAVNWGGEEASDEWFNWNIEQDKILDEKYGLSIYDDLPSPTPTIKPTAKPSITPKPTVKPTLNPTPTTAPNTTPQPLTISSIEVTCSIYRTPCGNSSSTQLRITGSGFSAGANPTITAISNNPNGSAGGGPQEIAGILVVNNDGTLNATFNSGLNSGDYKARIKQYGQTVEGNFTVPYYDLR